MPFDGQYNQGGASVWVWRITETVDELALLVDEESAAYARAMFPSGKRCAEWLAVRALVARQLPGARIVYDNAGKPSLEGAGGYLSISHTDGYAVIAFSQECEVGVDVELVSRNVLSASRRLMRCRLPRGTARLLSTGVPRRHFTRLWVTWAGISRITFLLTALGLRMKGV